jgi:hypothetical protein
VGTTELKFHFAVHNMLLETSAFRVSIIRGLSPENEKPLKLNAIVAQCFYPGCRSKQMAKMKCEESLALRVG